MPATALAQAVRAVMRDLDPELPIYAVRTVESVVSERAWTFRFSTYLLACFAGVALLLAAVGLSGIMAQVVIERTHEIGVRMALGATARDVVGMIVTRGMAVVAIGAVFGLIAAAAVARLLASELFGVKPNDAATVGLSSLCSVPPRSLRRRIPARRAARVDRDRVALGLAYGGLQARRGPSADTVMSDL